MDIKKQFLKTIKKYDMVQKGDRVIVGVSGGPDSVCLLHLFMTFRDELGITLYVAHLDHMFRGKESEEDARFVKALCKKWGIPFSGDKIDVPKYAKKSGLSPEDAARRVRYDFFKQLKEQIGAEKIATGHNRNDHEETILMNIFRGAGLDGLVGIDPVRDYFIRPLIEIPREAIENNHSEMLPYTQYLSSFHTRLFLLRLKDNTTTLHDDRKHPVKLVFYHRLHSLLYLLS
jgi:tRNA(Ile)-lysidine synthase